MIEFGSWNPWCTTLFTKLELWWDSLLIQRVVVQEFQR